MNGRGIICAEMGDGNKDGIDARRIARNAAWLYVRLAVVTVAGLVTVRVVMKALGVSGFGVYSAVSGAVSLIFFLQWTMELAVRRFLCVEIEGEDRASLAVTFTGGLLLALCWACCLLLSRKRSDAGSS